jgi:cytochrome c5
MKTLSIVLSELFLLAFAWNLLAQPQTPAASRSVHKTATKQTAVGNEGERRFQENCGRCHNYPDSISPREAKAVVRHMRVRAMLTEEDERLILKYLAP